MPSKELGKTLVSHQVQRKYVLITNWGTKPGGYGRTHPGLEEVIAENRRVSPLALLSLTSQVLR